MSNNKGISLHVCRVKCECLSLSAYVFVFSVLNDVKMPFG